MDGKDLQKNDTIRACFCFLRDHSGKQRSVERSRNVFDGRTAAGSTTEGIYSFSYNPLRAASLELEAQHESAAPLLRLSDVNSEGIRRSHGLGVPL